MDKQYLLTCPFWRPTGRFCKSPGRSLSVAGGRIRPSRRYRILPAGIRAEEGAGSRPEKTG